MNRHFAHIFRPDQPRPSCRPIAPEATGPGTLVLQVLIAGIIGAAAGALAAWSLLTL